MPPSKTRTVACFRAMEFLSECALCACQRVVPWDRKASRVLVAAAAMRLGDLGYVHPFGARPQREGAELRAVVVGGGERLPVAHEMAAIARHPRWQASDGDVVVTDHHAALRDR